MSEFVSRWFAIDQALIDAFAALTEDEQFIHVDPERARGTPFGGTVAHGFLTLSLLSAMAYDALPFSEDVAHSVNYGFDKVRFLAPVLAGAQVRGRFRIVERALRAPNERLTRYEVSIEIDGAERPAIAAQWLTLQKLK